MMKPATINAIRHHAEAKYPRESCGLVMIRKGREKYLACKNSAPDTAHFIISAQDYANAEEQGEIIAVVHSHPDAPPTPSEADKVSCEASGLVWHIVRVDSVDGIPIASELVTIEPCGYHAPLVGRPFFHAVLDCYSLIRDWYQHTYNIEIKQFHRTDDWWNDGTSDLYTQGFPQAGFVPVGIVFYMTNAAQNQHNVDKLREAMRNSKGLDNFENLFMYAPNQKKDGIQILPVSDVVAKDEFFNIKGVTRDDVLAAHRVPPQLLGIMPNNTGGFGAVEPAARVFSRAVFNVE